MGGKNNTYIDLNNYVSDKLTVAQSSLMLSVTNINSDELFEDKGTDLIPGTVNNNVINYQQSQHSCNFASLNILNFVKDNFPNTEDLQVSDVNMSVISYDPYNASVKIQQIVEFSDGTSTQPVINYIF